VPIQPDELADPRKLIAPARIATLNADVARFHPTLTEHNAARVELETRLNLYAALTNEHAAALALEQAKTAEKSANTFASTTLRWTRALVAVSAALVIATGALVWVTAIHQ
jgi:hypothetical protein